MLLDFLNSILGADKLAGYVRAAVAAGLTWFSLKYPLLGAFFTPGVAEAVQVIAVAAGVGIWSWLAKKLSA
jgi:hypothetical protein